MQVLDLSEVVKRAPSVGATTAHYAVSKKYVQVNTLNICEMLTEMGWAPVSAVEQVIKAPGRLGFQKHMVKFRNVEQARAVEGFGGFKHAPGDHVIERDNPNLPEFFELVLQNSHDRSCAIRMFAGLHVQICANGLIISKNCFGEFSIPHINVTRGEIIANVNAAAARMSMVTGMADSMKQVDLKDYERISFANDALVLKYGSVERAPISAEVLLEPRREADRGVSLWKTYQVTQENIIRGLQRDEKRRDPFGRRMGLSNPIVAIDRSTQLNQGLWDLAMAQLN